MNTILEILTAQAQYVINSGYTVRINRPFSWVYIELPDDEFSSIFLQGDEADNYINEVDKLSEENPTIEFDVILYSLAKPYIESL